MRCRVAIRSGWNADGGRINADVPENLDIRTLTHTDSDWEEGEEGEEDSCTAIWK